MDNLLNELNEVQLGKESMSCIKGGGQCGYETGSWDTKSGQVLEYYCPETECYTMYWNGGQIFPHELSQGDRTLR